MSHDQERAGRYSDLFASGAEEDHRSNCSYCPICATIGVLRNTKPEVLDHLASAVRELVVAAGLLLDEAEKVTASTGQGPERASHSGRVSHIDIA
jgi:hypothetical protein